MLLNVSSPFKYTLALVLSLTRPLVLPLALSLPLTMSLALSLALPLALSLALPLALSLPLAQSLVALLPGMPPPSPTVPCLTNPRPPCLSLISLRPFVNCGDDDTQWVTMAYGLWLKERHSKFPPHVPGL